MSQESLAGESGERKSYELKLFSVGYYKDLLAFKKAYELAMEIFIITKRFPFEERYSETVAK